MRLALIARTGEMGYPSVLTAPVWGFYDVSFKGKPFTFQRPYGSYVMENVLFKISFPAEFHAQTAAEAAMTLFGINTDEIAHIRINTHDAAIPDYRQEGTAEQPRGQRSLHPIHDRDPVVVRTPYGRRL